MRAFPPRLPDQPIFYPVLQSSYADQIARDWNSSVDPFAGYVLRFSVPDAVASKFGPHRVGATEHQELWVPAERLSEFNATIDGRIVFERAFFGKAFTGYVPARGILKGSNAIDQLVKMLRTLDYSGFDFLMEVSANSLAFFLHFPFWSAAPASRFGISDAERDRMLRAVETAWSTTERPAPLVRAGIAV